MWEFSKKTNFSHRPQDWDAIFAYELHCLVRRLSWRPLDGKSQFLKNNLFLLQIFEYI